ncbi:MAG: DUF4139 domain-containing protein [Deltaproteobacteria bacterium]|nr:DUF4139 domain-containing protein [Deltaproteobacteria bacterium]
MRRDIVAAWVLVGVVSGSLGCGAGSRPVVEAAGGTGRLSLRRVVLFQNGLGYFERRGTMEGRSVDLSVRPDQVDDVLKSLTVVDERGATISSVRVLRRVSTDAVKTLRIGLSRDGEHDLRITYVAEVTGWKPTYRVVAGDRGRVRLQGLAVVDNRTGEDWHDVSLGLSTEVPLSFRYDLAAPRVGRRPRFSSDGRLVREEETELNGARAHVSNVLPSEVNAAYAMAQREMPQLSTRAGRRLEDESADEEPAAPEPASPGGAPEDPVLLFERGENGDGGFLVDSAARVSLGLGESGLVPLVDREVPGETVLFYRPVPGGALSQEHPYRAVLFENPLAAPLLGGPVSIHARGRFLGDGVTGTIPEGTHAFVAYALEPSVSVRSSQERVEDEIRAVRLVGGTLEVELRAVLRTRFEVTSSRPRREKTYLFAAAVPGFAADTLPPGTIATPAGWFLPVAPGPSNATVTLELRQRNRAQANVAADPSHAYVVPLLTWLEQSGPESAEPARLREILDRLARLAEVARGADEALEIERRGLEERRQALIALRDVPANAALRRRLAAGVASGIAAVDRATRELSAARAEEVSLRQEWWARLRELTVGASRAPR